MTEKRVTYTVLDNIEVIDGKELVTNVGLGDRQDVTFYEEGLTQDEAAMMIVMGAAMGLVGPSTVIFVDDELVIPEVA